jgi:hypothetical protein
MTKATTKHVEKTIKAFVDGIVNADYVARVLTAEHRAALREADKAALVQLMNTHCRYQVDFTRMVAR